MAGYSPLKTRMLRSPIAAFCSAMVYSRRWRFVTAGFSISKRISHGWQTGLGILGFAQAVDSAKLRAGIAQYLASEEASLAVLRLTVTRGPGPRGLATPETPHPTLFMTLAPMPPAAKRPSRSISQP